MKPLIKDTLKKDKPPNKGQAESTRVYTLCRKSPLKEDKDKTTGPEGVSSLRGSMHCSNIKMGSPFGTSTSKILVKSIHTILPSLLQKSAVMSVPYYVDHNNSSEAGSELPSTLHAQIPTPHFGESYSQSGYSPVMQRRQAKHSPPSSKRSQPREGESNSKLATEEDDGTEFIDNDAYITFSAPGPAKFSIVGGERGGVFETVQAKRGVKS